MAGAAVLELMPSVRQQAFANDLLANEHGQSSDSDSQCDDDNDENPLLRRARPPESLRRSRPIGRRRCDNPTLVIYFLVMAVNGGLIGALGPSLAQIGRATGLHDASLATFVFLNRLCKLLGTFIWCAYARTLQRPSGWARPNAAFAGLMFVTASAAVALGSASRPAFVALALLAWGLAYGITDSGVTSLTVWRWGANQRRCRIDVAMLNAGFTVGALLSPALVAASLRYGGGRWAFHVVALVAALTGSWLCMQPRMALPICPRTSTSEADGAGGAGGRSPAVGQAPVAPRAMLGYEQGMRLRQQRARQSYERCFILAMAVVLASITACEHGLATWLSPYGIEVGELSAQQMALMASIYWGVMYAPSPPLPPGSSPLYAHCLFLGHPLCAGWTAGAACAGAPDGWRGRPSPVRYARRGRCSCSTSRAPSSRHYSCSSPGPSPAPSSDCSGSLRCAATASGRRVHGACIHAPAVACMPRQRCLCTAAAPLPTDLPIAPLSRPLHSSPPPTPRRWAWASASPRGYRACTPSHQRRKCTSPHGQSQPSTRPPPSANFYSRTRTPPLLAHAATPQPDAEP